MIAWLDPEGHDGDLIDAVRLLVSELVTNGVRHADLAIDQPLRLTASLRRATLRDEVRNEGTRGTVARRTPEPRATTGFGLNLVEQLSRAWGVERDADGTTVCWNSPPTPATEAESSALLLSPETSSVPATAPHKHGAGKRSPSSPEVGGGTGGPLCATG